MAKKKGARVDLLEPLRERIDAIYEIFTKVQKEVEKYIQDLVKKRKLIPEEVIKRVRSGEIARRIKATRSEIEKRVEEGIDRALKILNIPSRESITQLGRKIDKMAKDIESLKKKSSTP